MKPKVIKDNTLNETTTYERCSVAENYSSKEISIARTTVKVGVTTVAHHLNGVKEIYLITSGRGIAKVGELEPTEVAEGDVVVIPPGVSQKITNIGNVDLVFYCICTPKFTANCYCDEEAEKKLL
jgi:mannose-6-phosphate isomerase-like protein (cupin superfamily)